MNIILQKIFLDHVCTCKNLDVVTIIDSLSTPIR